MDSARPRSLSFYRVRRHCAMDPAWIHDGSDVSDFTKPYVFIWILLGSTMDPTLHCPRNHILSQGSCLDPRWFQDGLHAGIWAKPYVFIGILLGSTMDPTLLRQRNHMCSKGVLLGLRGTDQRRLRRRGPLPGAAVEGGGPRPPQGRPPREVTRFRAKPPQLRCLEQKTQSKLTFAPV